MRTRAAALIATALVATGLPALQSSQAADPPGTTEVAIVSASDQLLQQSSPNGPRTALGDSISATRPIYSLAVSQDGSRVITTEEPLTPSFVFVRDVGGATVSRVTDFGDQELLHPELSPDGSRFAYGDREFDSGTRTGLFTSGVIVLGFGDSGEQEIPTAGPIGLTDQVFLTQDLLLVKDAASSTALARFRAIGLYGGASKTVVGLTDTSTTDLHDFALDPTGTRMTYVRTSGASSAVEVVPVTVTATQVVFGPKTVLVTGSVGAPAFTRDGSTVVYASGVAPNRDLFSVPATGGAAEAYGPLTPSADEAAVVFGAKEASAPAAVPLGRARLGEVRGTFVTIPVQVTDPTLSRLRVTRSAVGEESYESDSVLPGPITDGGLLVGRTYTYSVQPFDRSGNAGPVSTTQLVATAPPTMATADPTSSTSVVSGFDVGIAARGNAPDTRYTVDSRVQGRTAWERLATLSTASSVRSRGGPRSDVRVPRCGRRPLRQPDRSHAGSARGGALRPAAAGHLHRQRADGAPTGRLREHGDVPPDGRCLGDAPLRG